MARGYTTRKLEVFSVHARRDAGGPIDYLAFFQEAAAAPPETRSYEVGDRLVAVPTLMLAAPT